MPWQLLCQFLRLHRSPGAPGGAGLAWLASDLAQGVDLLHQFPILLLQLAVLLDQLVERLQNIRCRRLRCGACAERMAVVLAAAIRTKPAVKMRFVTTMLPLQNARIGADDRCVARPEGMNDLPRLLTTRGRRRHGDFKPTEAGENRFRSSLSATYVITFCALTLLPASSSRRREHGDGALARERPRGCRRRRHSWPEVRRATPSRPSRHRDRPSSSSREYAGMFSGLITCLPVTGFTPLLARVAPICASCFDIDADRALLGVDVHRFQRSA